MIDTKPWQHRYDAKPTATGWYPVLHLWDSWEGHLPNAEHWDGRWGQLWFAISYFIDRRFDTEEEAKAYAVVRASDPR